MGNQSELLLDRLFQLGVSELPEGILCRARKCLLDYVGVTFGGSLWYEARDKRYITENGAEGAFSVLGLGRRADLRTAVMMNAFHAHVLELDDSHRAAMTHLGAPIISALLGAAELRDCSIEQLLRGIVIGYEAAIRVANVIQPSHKKRGFHVSGTCCTIGAAMGIAGMLGYTRPEMKNVLSASATSAAGLLEVIGGRSEQKPYNIANAAVSGLDAALYGKLFEGADDILAGKRGFYRAVSDSYAAEKLMEPGYAIEGIYQKLYASCRHCHAPVEAVLNLRAQREIAPEAVESVTVQTYDLAILGHDHTDITGISSAKQSIPYSVAAALVLGDGGLRAYSEEAVQNSAILGLAKRVTVSESAELSGLVPERRPATVTVTDREGKTLSSRVDYAKGEPENPITDRELMEKYLRLTDASGRPYADALRLSESILDGRGIRISELFEKQGKGDKYEQHG